MALEISSGPSSPRPRKQPQLGWEVPTLANWFLANWLQKMTEKESNRDARNLLPRAATILKGLFDDLALSDWFAGV